MMRKISRQITFNSKVDKIPTVGTAISTKLTKLSIETVRDLLFHFPVRYEDTRKIQKVRDYLVQGSGTIMLTITQIKKYYTPRRKMVIVDATGTDGQDFINLRWYNQAYITSTIKPGNKYLFDGKLSIKYRDYHITNPQFEAVRTNSIENLVHLGRIMPIYPETKGISSKRIRSILVKLKTLIREITPETLSKKILSKENLISLPDALYKIHFPEDQQDIDIARERLGFEELYNIQKNIRILKQSQTELHSQPMSNFETLPGFVKNLPYNLTKAQKKATTEILADMKQSIPMHRILTGDVGSGKTVVAIAAMIRAFENGYSSIIMAPTTILARQHYSTIREYLSDKYPITLVTGGSSINIDPSSSQFIVGTHALLHRTNQLPKIGLLIIDEQHRFGVKQRARIASVKDLDDNVPHYLIMSATPIPRTLALSLYGNLEISYLDEMPEGRIPVKTILATEDKRDQIYSWILQKIQDGNAQGDLQQLIIICPLISDSEVLQSKAAESVYADIDNSIFSVLRRGLIHGRMKEQEKQAVLNQFAQGGLDILVATPVIEVGIDIPNATMMMIENSERFGLAQLHQLRGRIGRRQKQAYCFLFASSETADVTERLGFFSKNSDGLKVAEYDLERRGPGEVYGTAQSGIPDLKIASLMDTALMKRARDAAFTLQ